MRTRNHEPAARSRAPRTALLVGAALAAPLAAVGVANAAVGPDGRPATAPPAEPAPAPAGPAPAGVATPPEPDVAAAAAFWDAGYQWCDAAAIAEATAVEAWDAKVGVGARLLAGQAVDPPSGCVDGDIVAVEGHDAALVAFWDAGYAYCDAASLAEAMGSDPFEVKVQVGEALLAGGAVPAPPSGCTG